jgi:biopolymer transport protein ExbB/TolQ
MKDRNRNLFTGVILALIAITTAVVGEMLSPEYSMINRIFILLGGNLPGGIIQFLIYTAFFWCLLEIQSRKKFLRQEEAGYQVVRKFKHFPDLENVHLVVPPESIRDLKIEVIDYHRNNKKYLVTDIIKKACTKLRADNSISDVLSIVSEQARLNLSKAESGQAIIRFLVWSLPSIGFIGTILGIANALSMANEASTSDGLEKITDALYLAFAHH